MKANELMIGDWVLIKTDTTNVARVEEIYPNGVITIDGRASLEDEIFPIPLTPEILEKNGWHKYYTYHILGLGDGASLWFYWFDSRLELQWQGIDEWQGNREVTEINFRSIGVEYVHELQHALRLCGIDKDIIITED